MNSEPDLPYLAFQLLFFDTPAISNLGIGLSLLLIMVLLTCSGLISGSEVAYFSLSPNDIENLKEEDSSLSQRMLNLLETPRSLLATILISNNFVNVGIIITADFLFRHTLTEEICQYWASNLLNNFYFLTWSNQTIARAIHFIVTTVVVTYILLLFGEVAPKIYSKSNNIRIAQFMAYPLTFLRGLFSPLSQILINWTQVLEKKMATKPNNKNQPSKEEIGEAIDLAVRSDLSATNEIDILKSIVNFGDVSVKQIMRPRVSIVSIDYETSYSELLKIVRESGFSRIPVYKDSFDYITGILYAKDLLSHLDESDNFEWQKLLRTDVLFVPESKKVDGLLKEFQTKRMHIAIIVDEYGGTSGIVTLEDIIEVILGEIRDEFDDETDIDFQKIDDYNYIFEGKTRINDICRVLNLDNNVFDEIREDADSIAGLILEMIGRLPRKGAEITRNDFKFKIISVSKKRIEQVQITLPS